MEQFVLSGFSDEIAPETAAQFAHLHRLGIRYFEPRGIDGKNIAELTDGEAQALKEAMDRAGIQASSIGSPIGKIPVTQDFAPHLEALRQVMRTAKILGSRYIRVFSFYIPQGEAPERYREEVLRRMKAMTQAAEQEGLILLHENEKGIYGDIAPRCREILEAVDSPNLRAVFDPANFIQCGQKVWPGAWDLLRPYVAYMHIKDATAAGQVVPAGMGIGCLEELLTALRDSGWHGFLSLEPHLGQFQGLAALERPGAAQPTDASNEGKFTLAYEALTAILERIGAAWKK